VGRGAEVVWQGPPDLDREEGVTLRSTLPHIQREIFRGSERDKKESKFF